MPYRQEILDSASQTDLGLMTTWDLFRLVRSFLRNKWKPECVKPLFYESRRISIIPVHYEYIGKIEHIWKESEAFRINIENSKIKTGEKIGIETPIDIIEYEIASIMLNNHLINLAEPGNEVGIKTKLFPENIKTGYGVFRVKTVT